jgi:hypothetical protein
MFAAPKASKAAPINPAKKPRGQRHAIARPSTPTTAAATLADIAGKLRCCKCKAMPRIHVIAHSAKRQPMFVRPVMRAV